jgi:hypothetical protein
MKFRRAILLGMALTGLSLFLASAQTVPQLINYQGRLTNASGQPLDGVQVDLTFTFYPTEMSGTPLLTVTQPGVLVSKGIYNLLIGSGGILTGTETTLAGVFQNHAQVWMGVQAGTDPEMTPRTRISSVGYALKADTANTAGTANTALAVSPGAILASSIGENCAVGEGLFKTASGWRCAPPWGVIFWTWISGSNAINQSGVYGTKGTPDAANVPGARDTAVSWADASGNLWLFGGYGYAASTSGRLNDLWKWDGTNLTWVSGSNAANQNGVYGTKGVPDAANAPGSRQYAVTWRDASGNLWLFGGYGYFATGGTGWLNDLWRWDGTNWTWVSGSNSYNQNGVYGTKGTPDPANVPGSRSEAVSWRDVSGNFWLFGGSGYAASGGSGNLNDLWKWDGTNWTWISGSNATNQNGVYGSQGAPNPANVPGSRSGAVSWTDTAGTFWLFGGWGYAASGSGYLNDLWKWDGTNWTWVSGNNAANQYGVYGTKGFPGPANAPGSRRYTVSWRDVSGNFWLFGGNGYAASGQGNLNDLWKWDGANWTWVSGNSAANQYGVYGTKGTPDSANVPGSRYEAVSWTDASGNLWLFGGNGYAASGSGRLNDLWRFY